MEKGTRKCAIKKIENKTKTKSKTGQEYKLGTRRCFCYYAKVLNKIRKIQPKHGLNIYRLTNKMCAS